MAQTAPHSMATGIVSTPFPPGLSNGAASTNTPAQPAEGAASAASQDGATGRRAWLDERSDRQALVDDVRRAVLEEIDVRVAEKMKDLWSKGNTMLKKVELENQQKNAKMLNEIAQCRLKQDTMLAEHEHLKSVLAGMVQQFNMLGAMYGSQVSPKAVPPMPASVAAGLVAAKPHMNGTQTPTDAPVNSSAASSSTLQDSPSSFAGGSFPPLPAVPDFPFLPAANPATPNAAATPLSLAEALGAASSPSPSVPVSLMGSLAASSQHIFSFTLRKADGTDLGLNVSHHEDDKALRVEGVRPEGAVEAWNRACIGSTQSEKAVLPGDRIVSVNGVVSNPVKMLEECRDRQLLKLTVIRGESFQKPTTLRADASEFVPAAAPGLEAMTEAEQAAKAVVKDDADDKEAITTNATNEKTSEL